MEKLWILNEQNTNLYFRCEKQWVLKEKNIDLVLDVKNNEVFFFFFFLGGVGRI